MDNTINVPRLASIAELAYAPCYPLLDQNWPGYPSSSSCSFHIGSLSGDKIAIRFTVLEPETRTVNTKDHDPVWQDSCVEFFAQIPGSDTYCNFEFNSRGVCLASSRKGRKDDVRPFDPEQMSLIQRVPHPIPGGWQLTVVIPASLLGVQKLPAQLKANLYKCGDLTAQPHFHSWCRIDTPEPDFHRPEYFGTLVL